MRECRNQFLFDLLIDKEICPSFKQGGSKEDALAVFDSILYKTSYPNHYLGNTSYLFRYFHQTLQTPRSWVEINKFNRFEEFFKNDRGEIKAKIDLPENLPTMFLDNPLETYLSIIKIASNTKDVLTGHFGLEFKADSSSKARSQRILSYQADMMINLKKIAEKTNNKISLQPEHLDILLDFPRGWKSLPHYYKYDDSPNLYNLRLNL